METVLYESAALHTTTSELPISLGSPPCLGAHQSRPEVTTIDYHSSIPTGRREIAITIENADGDENPPPPFCAPSGSLELFVSPNSQKQSESSTISMENSNHDTCLRTRIEGHIATSIQNEPLIADIWSTEFHNYRGILYLINVGALVYMFPSLTQLVQLKFQNNKQSPFETLSFFANMAVVSYTIAILTILILIYMQARLKTSIRERRSATYYVYTILKGVFCIFGVLAPLWLVLMLLIPSHV